MKDVKSEAYINEIRNSTFWWRDMFYRDIQAAWNQESITDWINNIMSMSDNCKFAEDCCKSCKDNRIFDALLFCMKDCFIKDKIRQSYLEGSIKNLKDALKFLKEAPYMEGGEGKVGGGISKVKGFDDFDDNSGFGNNG